MPRWLSRKVGWPGRFGTCLVTPHFWILLSLGVPGHWVSPTCPITCAFRDLYLLPGQRSHLQSQREAADTREKLLRGRCSHAFPVSFLYMLESFKPQQSTNTKILKKSLNMFTSSCRQLTFLLSYQAAGLPNTFKFRKKEQLVRQHFCGKKCRTYSRISSVSGLRK